MSSPVMSSPVMSSPVMSSPVMSSPVMSSPVMSSPVMSSPVMSSPVMSSPVMSSPVMSSPVMSSPVMSSPVMSSPVMSSPVMSSPVMSSPVMSSPVMSSPVMSSPVMSSPVMSSPVMSSPVMSSPVMSSPVMSSPVMSSPVMSSSVGHWTTMRSEQALFSKMMLSARTPPLAAATSAGLPMSSITAPELAASVSMKRLTAPLRGSSAPTAWNTGRSSIAPMPSANSFALSTPVHRRDTVLAAAPQAGCGSCSSSTRTGTHTSNGASCRDSDLWCGIPHEEESTGKGTAVYLTHHSLPTNS